MTKITVGKALHRFRTRRGISQFDLAVCMEWKGTNPVVQIEKDRRMPRPETLTKLGECLGLNYLELHYINGLAGYLPPTPRPPLDYVIQVLGEVADLVKDFPYPAYVLDYQRCFWVVNPAFALFIGGDYDLLRQLMGKPLYLFDMIFDSRLGMRQQIPDQETSEREQIFRFKATNALRQHEDFFITFPERMKARWLAEDYQHFIRLWDSIDINVTASYRTINMRQMYAQMEHGDLQLPFPEGSVAFHILADVVLHLGSLFQIVTLIPVGSSSHADNPRLAEQISARYVPKAAAPLKLWELMDVREVYGGNS